MHTSGVTSLPLPTTASAALSSTQVRVPEAFQSQARAYLSSYIIEHNVAFQAATSGPSRNLYTDVPLAVTAAIFVTLAVIGPFNDYLLKWICRRCPGYLHSRCAKAALKVALHVCCNVLLSIVAFVPPLFSDAADEVQMEKFFSTWDLRSTDLQLPFINESISEFRFLYIFFGWSNVINGFLVTVTFVVPINCLIVASCTVGATSKYLQKVSAVTRA